MRSNGGTPQAVTVAIVLISVFVYAKVPAVHSLIDTAAAKIQSSKPPKIAVPKSVGVDLSKIDFPTLPPVTPTGPDPSAGPVGAPTTTVAVATSTTTATTTTVAPAPQPVPALVNELTPGLAELGEADRVQAIAFIDTLRTAGRGPKTGYTREEFGIAWTDEHPMLLGHNRCDTRSDILRRDLDDFTPSGNCIVSSGHMTDPYTATGIDYTRGDKTSIDIDHVVPLSYAWQMGAQRWSPNDRTALANDPLNLLAVDFSANRQKGDSSPASWLPKNKAIRCAYSLRFAAVAARYDLAVTVADKAKMLETCS